MSDDLRAAEALQALQAIDSERIQVKSNTPGAVLDVESRDVTTLFSVDCLDSVGDITPVSAFRTSLQGKAERIPHLWMHDLMGAPLAVIKSFQEVKRHELPDDVQQEYPEATGGLACVSRYLTTPRASEIFEGIKAGVPFGASFGYQVMQATPHRTKQLSNGKPARVLNEVRLFEVSVTQPNHAAQPATRVRLGKALALLEELKTGRRHSAQDTDFLNQIAALVIQLGATNAQLIEAVAPDDQVGTSPVDALIHDLEVLYQ